MDVYIHVAAGNLKRDEDARIFALHHPRTQRRQDGVLQETVFYDAPVDGEKDLTAA